MARTPELPQGQLNPVAKPVSTFLNFEAERPAAPGQPSQLGSPKLVNIVQRGGGANVRGFNSFQQLAESLKVATGAVDAGLQLYASNEYLSGKNEVLKAAHLANTQMLNAGEEYAKDNREVARANPVAGVLMDEANPFRRAGRMNQGSILLQKEIPAAFRQLWREQGDRLVQLDSASPEINKALAEATLKATGKYPIDEFSPGFQENVVPMINKYQEWFRDKQSTGRNDFLKATQADLIRKELFSLLWNGTTGTQEQQMTLLTRAGGILHERTKDLGIPGDVPKIKGEALVQLAQQLQQFEQFPEYRQKAYRLRQLLGAIPVNQQGELAASQYGIELASGQDKLAQIYRREQEAADKQGLRDFETKYGQTLMALPRNSPDYNRELSNALADPAFSNLPLSERVKSLQAMQKAETIFATGQIDYGAIRELRQTVEGQFGANFNEAKAREAFNQIQFPDGAEEEAIKQANDFEALLKRKRDQTSIPRGEVTSAITDATKEQLVTRYPDLQSVATKGGDVMAHIQNGDEAKQRASTAYQSQLQKYVYEYVSKAAAQQGAPISDPAQRTQLIQEAIEKFNGNKAVMDQIFITPEQLKKQRQPEQKTGTKPAVMPTYRVGSLTTIPTERIEQWKDHALLNADDTERLLLQALNGQQLPAPFRNAAIRAGTTWGQLLLKQADLQGEGFRGKPTDAQRRQILNMGNQSKSFQDGFATASPGNGPLSIATNLLLNVLTGSAPAQAAVIQRPQGPTYSSGGRYVATAPRGYSADRMTQTLHGLVGQPGYDANHGVRNDHVHHGSPDQRTALALANFMKANGVPVSEFAQSGKVAPVHKDPGHYTGMSMDFPVPVSRHQKVLNLIDLFYAQRRR